MAAKDWATLILAIIGMVTGVASLTWNVVLYLLRDRPRLKLRTSWGYGNLPHMGEGHVIITAANETRHAVIVESVGFDLSNGRQLLFPFSPKYEVPYEVRPGGKYEAWAFMAGVREQIKAEGQDVYVVRAWANDAVGKRWKKAMPRRWTEQLLQATT